MTQTNDFVIIKDTGEIGVVVEVLQDPLQYRVQSRGNISTHSLTDLLGLNSEQVLVLNRSLAMVARIIHAYHDEENYDPVFDDNGEVHYSSPAATIFQALEFPRLIVELEALSDKVFHLERELSEARAQR